MKGCRKRVGEYEELHTRWVPSATSALCTSPRSCGAQPFLSTPTSSVTMADIKPAPVLLNHPLAKEFDKVSATIKQPISDGTLVQVRSLESAVHASCTTSIPVRAAATKLLAQATGEISLTSGTFQLTELASTRETRPPWVQEILDSLKRVEKSIERIEAKVDQISSIVCLAACHECGLLTFVQSLSIEIRLLWASEGL